MKIKIQMLKTSYGSDEDANGVTMRPKWFEAGKEYEVCPGLAKAFCDDLGVAKRVIEENPAEQEVGVPDHEPAYPVEEKAIEGAPENKAAAHNRSKKRK